MSSREVRRVYLSFEFERDAHRRKAFIAQAKRFCDFRIEDKSLPKAEHPDTWRRQARQRIRSSDVVIVLLGQDTHNAPGVEDELSLAGEFRKPVVQLMAQKQDYAIVSQTAPVCPNRWRRINAMLRARGV